MYQSTRPYHLFTDLCLRMRYGLCLLLVSLYSGTFAQSEIVTAQAALAEKIYLQVDADVYTTDQTIWFKAIILESASHRPSALSGVLYVELISPDERILAQRRIKVSHGIGRGSIELDEGMARGRYLLRAYTAWNRNFGEDFIFREYIDIFPVTESRGTDDPIPGVAIHEKEPGAYWLQAKIFPHSIDQSHRGPLTAYLTVDDQRDSVFLRESGQGYYALDHPLPAGVTLASVRIETRGGRRYTKTVALPRAPVDLQFFPEGGQWLTDIPTKVAFKALDHLGQGIPVSGRIMDGKGNVLGPFRSNQLGMGSVELIGKAGEVYHAIPDSIPGVATAEAYPLPQVQTKGYALRIRQQGDDIAILAHDRTGGADSLFLQIGNRGIFHYMVRALPRKGKLQAMIPAGALPEGIVSFTLMDHHHRPVAERIYFNQRPGTRLAIRAIADKDSYGKRDRTAVEVQVADSGGQPVRASISLMAIHRDHTGDRSMLRANILTQLLLQSEIRGEIEHPGYYFGKHQTDRSGELDDLLLSQGWRQYKYDTPPDTVLPYSNEPELVLSGEVSGGVIARRQREGAAISLLTFGEDRDMQLEQTDSLGRFRFPILLETDSVDVLLQSANSAGRNRNYSIRLDSPYIPEITLDPKQVGVPPDSTVAYLVQKREERTRAERDYLDAIEIEEVIVEERVRTRQEQRVFERFGKADTVISGEAIRAKERDWHYGLYSVLRTGFLDVLRIERVTELDDDGRRIDRLKASLGPTRDKGDNRYEGETLVVVDGIPVRNHSYDLIQTIPPSEVKSIEIFRLVTKNFLELFQEVNPFLVIDPREMPKIGHVLAIYTHTGKGLYNALNQPTGVLQATVPVYSPTVEFYAPRYGTAEERGADRPDLRTLLHWAPQLVTDEGGKVALDYYNADSPGQVTIVVEGVTPQGEIGYQELTYIVED